MPHSIGEARSNDANEYVRRENQQDIPVLTEKMLVAVVSKRLTLVHTEAVYRYHRGYRSRLRHPGSLLLPHLRRLVWMMFMAATQMATGKSMVPMAAPLRLVVGRSSRLNSTFTVTCFLRGMSSMLLVPSSVCWTGLLSVRAQVDC